MSKGNTIVGRVFVDETGAGISDFVVAVADVDTAGGTQPITRGPTTASVPPPSVTGTVHPPRRLGSALTGRDGSFTLVYQDGDVGEARPDLVLAVFPPERPRSDPKMPIAALYASVIP